MAVLDSTDLDAIAARLLVSPANKIATDASNRVSANVTKVAVTDAATFANGIAITQSTLGGSGLSIEGNGAGHGIIVTGGAAGNGVHLIGGGVGMKVIGTNDDALYLDGGTAHHGLVAFGGASGGGNGMLIRSQSGDADAISIRGFGQGSGFRCNGGATGVGFYAAGGATSGAGFKATTVTGGTGFDAQEITDLKTIIQSKSR
jgi:hypothetical protein